MMRLSSSYRICEILGEIYILPEEFDKEDMGRVERIAGSGSQMIREIEKGVSSMEELQNRICTFYEVDDSDKEKVCASVTNFVHFCLEKGYIELSQQMRYTKINRKR